MSADSTDSGSSPVASVLDVLEARGFVAQCTDREALSKALEAGAVRFYVGFDPTADSLHIGHLLPVMAMYWLQQAGHEPVVVIGGGTGMVGDPSGKDKSRDFITAEQVDANIEGQRPQFGRILDLAADGEVPSAGQGLLVNNAEWLMSLGYIQFLRDIGRHFSVNRMLTAESTRLRLERNQGLSFIEFNYHLLQSYDFLVLCREHRVTLQLGGNDQWFNILGGIDLVRRVQSREVHGLTVPLLQTADGKKMGKTEKGAVWLDAAKCAPFDYFQYWVNVQDADVVRFLKLYTTLPLDRIEALAQLKGADVREAKRVLAFEATKLAHGETLAREADAAARKLFSGKGASPDAPSVELVLPMGILDVLMAAGLAKSRGEGRRLVKQGGVRIGDTKVSDPEAQVTESALVWKGKKRVVQVIAAG
jgi:tyrosyl-tRNA synthetase